MMTFKEYLIEAAMMSPDSMKQKASKFDTLGIGKSDGSKPNEKRATQVHKRAARKAGQREEEEEPSKPANRDVVKRIMDTPKETKEQKPSDKRRGQRAARVMRRSYGKGIQAKGAAPIVGD